MQTLRMALMAGATIIATSAGAGAQRRGSANIPAGYQPPAGMCRVWYDGVSPNRQPAPTDCGTARSHVAANTFLVYGAQGTQQNGTRDSRGAGHGGWYGDQIDNARRNEDGRYDSRTDGRYDPRNDGLSDKQRRKMEKEREKQWRKAHKGNGNRNGRDHDDDDDRDRDHDRDGNRDGHDQGTWNSRVNGGNQQPRGRVRIP